MVSIRPVNINDYFGIVRCNQECLPENYYPLNYMDYLTTWQCLQHVAEDAGKIVGYVLASVDQTESKSQGHIISLAVMRSHRQLGLARRLLELAHDAMKACYGVTTVKLHVRPSNYPARHLYMDSLGYQQVTVHTDYYGNEDGWELHKVL